MDYSTHADLTTVTYRYERWRAVALGVLETAGQTFLLLIAVRVLQAGPTSKALLSSATSIGLMLSVLTVAWVTHRRYRSAQAAAWLALAGALALGVAAGWPVLPVFLGGGMVALASVAMATPLMTQIYQDNYPVAVRGQLFSRSMIIRVAVAAGFSELAGRVVGVDLAGRMRWLLAMYAVALGFAAFCLSRVPSQPLAGGGSAHPLRGLRFVKSDRVFRLTLISWMLMGFANLMMLPLRVEYLANPKYGLEMSASTVALVVGVVPNLARLVMSPIWGWVFDRMNFFALRATLNVSFAVGIFAFFSSATLPGLLFGAVVFGIGLAGGDVAWNLWVTKFAPPERVADYMSVHTFFTGLRGIVAPLVAFHLVGQVSMVTLGAISAGLIVVATALLVKEIIGKQAADPGPTLVREATRE